mgnify:CR=1 FL=1
MKCLVITNNKGGVAKTTLAVHCLWLASMMGKKALLIDLDEEQANATRWCLAHKIRKPEVEKKYKSEWGGEVVYMPSKIPENYDLIIVDTRPSSVELGDLVNYITHILIPFKGRFGREGIEDIIETIRWLGWDGRIPMRAIQVFADSTIQSRQDLELAQKIGIPTFAPIKYYPFVDHALERGVPIWKVPWGVRTTILQRIKEIIEWVKP